MRIEAIYIQQFSPFGEQAVVLPKAEVDGEGELHLLVGENGTGKTRLLCLLAAALGNRNELDSRTGGDKSVNCAVVGEFGESYAVWGTARNHCWWTGENEWKGNVEKVLSGKNPGGTASTSLLAAQNRPKSAGAGTALAFRGTAKVVDTRILALGPVKVGSQENWLAFEHAAEVDLVLSQGLANIKLGAAMELMSAPSDQPGRATKIAKRLESAISQVTGRPFYFVVDSAPEVALKVYWGGVPMLLRQLPDGLRSIIGWLASCAVKLSAIHPDHEEPLSLPLILLIDEPESHLHPAWQRKVLGAAQAMFPQAQMFVATHSPFIISSANEGWIHVLRADDATGKVQVHEPKPCQKGDTWIDAVEDVLGIVEWYDPVTEGLLKQFHELRNCVVHGVSGDLQEVQALAQAIASRSASLSDLMGREVLQLERQLAQRGVES